MLLAYAAADETERHFWNRTIEKGRQEDGDFEHAIALLDKHGAIEGALNDARRYGAEAQTAIRTFPASQLRDDLDDLVSYVVDRDH